MRFRAFFKAVIFCEIFAQLIDMFRALLSFMGIGSRPDSRFARDDESKRQDASCWRWRTAEKVPGGGVRVESEESSVGGCCWKKRRGKVAMSGNAPLRLHDGSSPTSVTGEEKVCSLPSESAMDATDQVSLCPSASSVSQVVDWIARMQAARDKFKKTAARVRFASDNFDLFILAPALEKTRSSFRPMEVCEMDERNFMLGLDDRQVSALELTTRNAPHVSHQLDQPVFSTVEIPSTVTPVALGSVALNELTDLSPAAAVPVKSTTSVSTASCRLTDRDVAEWMGVYAADLVDDIFPLDKAVQSFMNISRPLSPDGSTDGTVLLPQPP